MELSKIIENHYPSLKDTMISKTYILTPEEEEKAIRNAINSEKEAWRYKRDMSKMLQSDTVEAQMEQIDFEKKIDKEKILRIANSNKHRLIQEKGELEKEREELKNKRRELEKKCDAKYFYRLMRSNYELLNLKKPFQQDSDNEGLIKIICFFLSRDPRLETIYRAENKGGKIYYDLNKGLLIRGVPGLGKTFLFELVKDNELNPIKIVSMIEVAEQINREGNFEFEMGDATILNLDDVGTEEAVINYYGTKINWFKDFIEKSYRNKNRFKNLVITTNLRFDEIEEKYGFRARSRMKEMFNIVDVNGKDRRK
jgi:hypothetical protein